MKAYLRKPFFMRLWDQYPRVWKHLINLGLLVKYQTLKGERLPNRVQLTDERTLFVDTEENRGRALLVSNGITQKRMYLFWTKAVQWFEPDLVVDVGVNYGECIFSTTYKSGVRIYGVEANRHLLPYIQQSQNVHPNGVNMTMIHALAADKNLEETAFYVDKHWSGTSSAAAIASHSAVEEIPTKSIRLDAEIEDAAKRLLFKVDVEGYEPFVLRGMTGLFERIDSIVGYIEFNSEYIEKAGIEIDEFLMMLGNYFDVFVYLKNDVVMNAKNLTYSELQETFGSEYIHTDLILVKNSSIIENLQSL